MSKERHHQGSGDKNRHDQIKYSECAPDFYLFSLIVVHFIKPRTEPHFHDKAILAG